jgi:capsid protein
MAQPGEALECVTTRANDREYNQFMVGRLRPCAISAGLSVQFERSSVACRSAARCSSAPPSTRPSSPLAGAPTG